MDNFMAILLTIQTYPYKHNLLKLKEDENSFIKTFYPYKKMSRSSNFTSELTYWFSDVKLMFNPGINLIQIQFGNTLLRDF